MSRNKMSDSLPASCSRGNTVSHFSVLFFESRSRRFTFGIYCSVAASMPGKCNTRAWLCSSSIRVTAVCSSANTSRCPASLGDCAARTSRSTCKDTYNDVQASLSSQRAFPYACSDRAATRCALASSPRATSCPGPTNHEKSVTHIMV